MFEKQVEQFALPLALWVLTAIIYPFVITLVGVFFPFQANGSIIENLQGQPIGSALIGQSFSTERYFQSRPSTVEYSQNPENIGNRCIWC